MTSQTQKKFFTQISPRVWEHPADHAALAALKQVPGVNEMIRFFIGATSEKSLKLFFLAGSVRVTERQFPRVHTLLEEACTVLDAPEKPDIFVTQNPMMNAGAIGVDHPFITINSSLLERLDDEELLCVIGHELGHIMSGHVLYKTLLWLLLNVSTVMVQLPLGMLAIQAVLAALREWDRKSELSADRAGLLVVQNPDASYRTLMKIAGGSDIGQMNMDEFFAQADEYDSSGNLVDGVYKLLNLLGQSHPFPVLRLAGIHQWVTAGSYQAIVDGTYARRDAGEQEDIMKEFQEAANQYREDIKNSKDPLAQAVRAFSDNVENATREAETFLRSVFKK